MSRFVSACGLIRLQDGSFLIRPAPVTPPVVTAIGQAQLRGDEYFQRVNVPSPPEHWEWRMWTFGRRAIVPTVGESEVFASRLGDPLRPLIFYLVSLSSESGYPRRTVSQEHAVTPNLPGIQPFAIIGSAALITTGAVGSPLAVQWPTIQSGTPAAPPIQRIDLYPSEGSLVLDESITDIPDTVPDWSGQWAQAFWSVVDPAFAEPRTYASPRVQITSAVVTPAPTYADIQILRSDYRPTGQTVTHSPALVFAPSLDGWEVRWRTGPFADTDAPYGGVEPNPGRAGEWRLADFFPNVGINSALYVPGTARTTTLRFSVRPNVNAPWSAEGPAYTVPNPAIGTSTAEQPLGAGAVTNPASNYVPGDQTDTFKPELLFPTLTAAQRTLLQFQAKRQLSETAWQEGALLSGDRFFVVSPAGVTPNPTLYSVGNTSLRSIYIRHRFDTAQEWSQPSAPYIISAPSIIVPDPDPEEPGPVDPGGPDPTPWRTIPESTAASALTNEAANATEFRAALVAAPAGVHIAIRNGARIGEINFTANLTKSTPVTVRPVNRQGAEVIFRNVYFRAVSGSPSYVCNGVNWENLTFRGNRSFRNEGVYPSRPSNQNDNSGGKPTGLWMPNCRNVRWVDCQFDFFDVMLEVSNFKDCEFLRCEFTRWGNDCIRAFNNIERIRMTYCWFHDNAVDQYQATSGPYENERHPDIFQMSYNNSGTDNGAKDIYLAFNYIFDVSGGYQQMFYCNSERGNSYQYADPVFPGCAHAGIRIINNYGRGGHTGGIVIGSVKTLIRPGLPSIESVFERNVFRKQGAGSRIGISAKGDNICRIINNVNCERAGSDIIPGTGGIRTERSRPRGSVAAPAGSVGTNSRGNNVQHSGNVASNTAFPAGWVPFRAGRAGFDVASPTT
jgi:hypothetical protein